MRRAANTVTWNAKPVVKRWKESNLRNTHWRTVSTGRLSVHIAEKKCHKAKWRYGRYYKRAFTRVKCLNEWLILFPALKTPLNQKLSFGKLKGTCSFMYANLASSLEKLTSHNSRPWLSTAYVFKNAHHYTGNLELSAMQTSAPRTEDQAWRQALQSEWKLVIIVIAIACNVYLTFMHFRITWRFAQSFQLVAS